MGGRSGVEEVREEVLEWRDMGSGPSSTASGLRRIGIRWIYLLLAPEYPARWQPSQEDVGPSGWGCQFFDTLDGAVSVLGSADGLCRLGIARVIAYAFFF